MRREIVKAALVVKCEASDLNFIKAFHLIQSELHWVGGMRS